MWVESQPEETKRLSVAPSGTGRDFSILAAHYNQLGSSLKTWVYASNLTGLKWGLGISIF